MRTWLPVIFSIFLISSVILVSSVQNSFADEIIATSTGFEDATILELKNSRGNTENIDSVRIWMSGDNEFKSFKTEQGWLGKKQLNGVIEFTSQKPVKPGESVKFGIKTIESQPIINWKAVNSNGEIISSETTNSTILKDDFDETELNKPRSVGINNDSIFRFIPDRPASDSNFRVVGEKFVPGQVLDFYIDDALIQTVKVDNDGKIFFTSKTPIKKNDERTEFILRDSGGSEKIVSIRIPESEKRDIAEIIKLSIGNTSKEVKRGEVILLEGMATPGVTLTITSKHPDGEIISIDTIQVGSDAKWNLEQLISPDAELGQLGIEVSDGKTKILRNFDVINPGFINVSSIETMYQPGDTVRFSGIALPDTNMSIILEDSIGTEVYSRSITVGNTGAIDFEINISRDSVEGTYVLHLFQGTEEGIATFGIGQEPEAILILRTAKLNYQANEDIDVSITSSSNAQISLILIDSADREILADTINLGPDGKEIYKIKAGELASGAYTVSAKRGESSGDVTFTVGFTSGSGAITVQTTKADYIQNDQVLILGSTVSANVLLEITIIDPSGEIIKRVETFSDKSGVFKIDNFRIPMDGKIGTWKIAAKSGGNFNDIEFVVEGTDEGLVLELEKISYNLGEIMNLAGHGANGGSTVSIKIFNSEGEKIEELNINAKSSGEFSTIWKIPDELMAGEYEITADDGLRNASTKFTIN